MIRLIRQCQEIFTNTERRRFVFFIAINAAICTVDLASLALLVWIVSYYSVETAGSANNVFLTHLFDKHSLLPISIFLLLFALKSLFGYLVTNAQFRFLFKVASRLSDLRLHRYLRGSFGDYVGADSSVQMRKVLHYPIEFGHFILAGLLQVFTEGYLSVMSFAALLLLNPALFLIVSGVLLPPGFLGYYVVKRRIEKSRINAKISSERSLKYLKEAISGYVEGRIYSREEFLERRVSKHQYDLTKFLSGLYSSQAVSSRMLEVFAVLGLFVLVLSRAFSGASGIAEPIYIGAYMAAAYRIIPGMIRISNILAQIRAYSYTVEEMPLWRKSDEAAVSFKGGKVNRIEFDNVSFRAKGQDIISHFSCAMYPGEITGVAGLSGRGKTTVLNLMLGFLDASDGEIRINGSFAGREIRQGFWPDIAYAQQRPFLLHDTVELNITLGDHNPDKLYRAVRQSGVEQFLNEQNGGLKMVISEDGKNISGGQRQRIGLARALFKDSAVIILDEPFSELDAGTEWALFRRLEEMAEEGKMIIITTHNREILSRCDRIYHVGNVDIPKKEQVYAGGK